MKTCFIQHSLVKTILAVLAAAVPLLASVSAQAALPANTSFMHGGNWAQNWQGGQIPTDVVYNAGINSNTTVAQAIQITDTLIDDYHSVGMNFVRYHLNPAAVSSNLAVTTNCINELIAHGMYVDLNCLYIDPATGKIFDITKWKNMWITLDHLYGTTTNVYFEPINEPVGYTPHDLSNLVYYPFLHNYGIVKRQDHMILDTIEPGCSTIGPMSAFSGCLMAVHFYDFGSPTDYSGYRQRMTNLIYGYQSRVIMNEVGATTDTGSDFLLPTHTGDAHTNVIFMNALCDLSASWNMGIAWYPSHQLKSNSNNKKMFNGPPGAAIVNRSLIEKLQLFWDFFTPLEAPGCDFNNIGQTDYSYYRPDINSFGIQSGGGGPFGLPGDIAVPADYNGVGTVQRATWNPTTHYWNIYPDMNVIQYGQSGDIPVPGDYRGIGSAQVAVFRPSNRTWIVNGKSDVVWGTNGDIPVPGYYNGDGHLDYATYRPSNGKFYVFQGAGPTFGQPGDVPVPGDYLGNGTTQFAVYRPANSTWYIYGVTNIQFGNIGDIPVPGDYTGAGYTQLATWNPSTFVWNVDGLSPVTWGATNYIPLPLPYAVRHACYGYNE